jgi:hypothetical protein
MKTYIGVRQQYPTVFLAKSSVTVAGSPIVSRIDATLHRTAHRQLGRLFGACRHRGSPGGRDGLYNSGQSQRASCHRCLVVFPCPIPAGSSFASLSTRPLSTRSSHGGKCCGRWPSKAAISTLATRWVRPLQRPRCSGTRIGTPLSGAGGAAIAHGVKLASLLYQKQHRLSDAPLTLPAYGSRSSTIVQYYATCENTGWSMGTPACRSASVHRRQDNIVQDVGGQHPLQLEIRIQTGRDHDDEVQRGNHKETLPAKADTGSPSDRALVHQ